MPSSSSSSTPVRSRRLPERPSRSSASSGKGSKSTHTSSRKSPKSSVLSPPLSPSQDAASLYSQKNVTLEALPPLPGSSATSPETSFVQLPRTDSNRSPTSRPESLDQVAGPSLQPTVEDEPNEKESLGPEPDVPDLTASEVLRSQVDKLPPPTEEHPTLDINEAVQYRSPTQSARSLSRSSSTISHTPYYLPQFHPNALVQYPLTVSHPLPPHFQAYHHPGPFFPPQGAVPHYYPAPPVFTSTSTPHGTPTHASFPHHYPPAFPTFVPAPSIPSGTSLMTVPGLERQTSVGSRSSMSAEAPGPTSPLGFPAAGENRTAFDPGGEEGGGANAATLTDDPNELTQRIQSTMLNMASISAALPDLHQLLSRYRETHGQLGLREELTRRTESQQAELLRQKEQHIEALGKQVESLINKHSAESSKLRLQVGNLEEKQKELTESLAMTERANIELQATKIILERDRDILKQNAKKEKEMLEKQFATLRKSAQQEFEKEMNTMREAYEDKLKGVTRESEEERAGMAAKFLQEKEAMQTAFANQKADLEAEFDSRQRELQGILGQERDRWQMERTSLLNEWQAKRDALSNEWTDKCKALAEEHTRDQERLQGIMGKLEIDLRNARSETETTLKTKEDLTQRWSSEKLRLESGITELRSIAETLGKEKGKLQRMVEAFGEVTDIKSKGDAFYIDALTILSKQIIGLSQESFAHPPATPPPSEVLARIPADIPPFLEDTEASRYIRAAYIQHLISSTLCHRIFHPFLFSVGRRYGKADSLFQAMSKELRHKSTRREAVWRQHTLYAAYTAPTAKKSTNAAAGAVVEEIVQQIKHWADPGALELMYAAVRRIVKMAAETWRYARLERQMITAVMPPAGDAKSDDDDWSCHEPSEATAVQRARPPRTILLRRLPAILREPIHGALPAEDQRPDAGCLYSRGMALCSHCPPILVRQQELQGRWAATRAVQGSSPSALSGAPAVGRSSGESSSGSGSNSGSGSEETASLTASPTTGAVKPRASRSGSRRRPEPESVSSRPRSVRGTELPSHGDGGGRAGFPS